MQLGFCKIIGPFHCYTLTPVLELALGLRDTVPLHNGKSRLTLQAGWEEQIWFSMNQFINPRAERSGNLTLQGATGRVGFAF